jgi:acetylornithine deacetylase/succinyl-diaminopimelate desuccinylase-like protein
LRLPEDQRISSSSRTGARLACLLVALIPLGGCRVPTGERGWTATPSGEDLRAVAAATLSAAIRIDTRNPPGRERPLAELLVDIARSRGLEARVIPAPPVGADAERAAAWAVLPGSGAARPLVLLSHLDVVPADPVEWAVDPFEGVVGGGFVVGRGALDAKGVAVVHLLALTELARRGIRLDRDVIFLAAPDEEMGGIHGSGALVRDRPELLRGAEFLLTEGGGIVPSLGDGPDVWGVTFTEKSPCWLELRTRGVPGHGASASAEGAVPRLVRALDRVRRYEAPVRVTPPVARMFRSLAPLAAPEDRPHFANLAEALESDAGFRQRFLAEPGQGALVRDTVAITVLEGSPSTNIAPAEARAHLDARLLPGETCEEFTERMAGLIDDAGVEISTLLAFEAGASPVATPLFAAIERVARRRDPAAVVVPRVIAGFTDAHWFREAGVVSYGFVPRRLRPVDTRGIHGPNERISLDNLELGIDVTIEILTELAGPRRLAPSGAPAAPAR